MQIAAFQVVAFTPGVADFPTMRLLMAASCSLVGILEPRHTTSGYADGRRGMRPHQRGGEHETSISRASLDYRYGAQIT